MRLFIHVWIYCHRNWWRQPSIEIIVVYRRLRNSGVWRKLRYSWIICLYLLIYWWLGWKLYPALRRRTPFLIIYHIFYMWVPHWLPYIRLNWQSNRLDFIKLWWRRLVYCWWRWRSGCRAGLIWNILLTQILRVYYLKHFFNCFLQLFCSIINSKWFFCNNIFGMFLKESFKLLYVHSF